MSNSLKYGLRAVTAALIYFAVASCAPSKHAVHVEMRYPSKSGIDLVGKVISVGYVANENDTLSGFNEAMASGFAGSLEKEYSIGNRGVGVYRIPLADGADYASKDTLINFLMDTGADIVFLFDMVQLGNMSLSGASHVAVSSSADSSYLSTASLPYRMKLYCFDAMNKEEKVQAFGGSSSVSPDVYSDGKTSREILFERAYAGVPEKALEAGRMVAASFESQWKHEQYSIAYYDSQKWYDALNRAMQYDWKGAMDIWIELLYTKDLMKKACAEYNIAIACYMLGDYTLAIDWLNQSDKDNKLPLSDALRKRIEARKN